jgi:putative transposase
LSLRDIEELLFERGIVVSYETVRCWCDKFDAGFSHRVKAVRRKPGNTWHLDELFVALRGEPYVLWRAVDEQGVELDILLQEKRDTSAANDSSSVCFVRARCRARSSLTSCAVIRPRSPESPSWQTSGTCSSRLQPASTIGPKIAINLRVNVSDACAGFATQSAPGRFSRTSDRSGNTSQSSDICCARLSTANSWISVFTHGIVSPSLPKIRPAFKETSVRHITAARTI